MASWAGFTKGVGNAFNNFGVMNKGSMKWAGYGAVGGGAVGGVSALSSGDNPFSGVLNGAVSWAAMGAIAHHGYKGYKGKVWRDNPNIPPVGGGAGKVQSTAANAAAGSEFAAGATINNTHINPALWSGSVPASMPGFGFMKKPVAQTASQSPIGMPPGMPGMPGRRPTGFSSQADAISKWGAMNGQPFQGINNINNAARNKVNALNMGMNDSNLLDMSTSALMRSSSRKTSKTIKQYNKYKKKNGI